MLLYGDFDPLHYILGAAPILDARGIYEDMLRGQHSNVAKCTHLPR